MGAERGIGVVRFGSCFSHDEPRSRRLSFSFFARRASIDTKYRKIFEFARLSEKFEKCSMYSEYAKFFEQNSSQVYVLRRLSPTTRRCGCLPTTRRILEDGHGRDNDRTTTLFMTHHFWESTQNCNTIALLWSINKERCATDDVAQRAAPSKEFLRAITP